MKHLDLALSACFCKHDARYRLLEKISGILRDFFIGKKFSWNFIGIRGFFLNVSLMNFALIL